MIPYNRAVEIWWRNSSYVSVAELAALSHSAVLQEMRNVSISPLTGKRRPLMIKCSYCGRVGKIHSQCEGCGAQVQS